MTNPSCRSIISRFVLYKNIIKKSENLPKWGKKLINRQVYIIIGINLNTSNTILISKSELIPMYIILDFWECMYAYQIFSLSDSIVTKDILLVTL